MLRLERRKPIAKGLCVYFCQSNSLERVSQGNINNLIESIARFDHKNIAKWRMMRKRKRKPIANIFQFCFWQRLQFDWSACIWQRHIVIDCRTHIQVKNNWEMHLHINIERFYFLSNYKFNFLDDLIRREYLHIGINCTIYLGLYLYRPQDIVWYRQLRQYFWFGSIWGAQLLAWN